MKTPALLEALLQHDARKAAIEVCSAWRTLDDRQACMLRQYPQELLSSDGAVLVKVAAVCLLLGAAWGLLTVYRLTWRMIAEGKYDMNMLQGTLQWAAVEAMASMWAVWKGLTAASFFIVLVQILLS